MFVLIINFVFNNLSIVFREDITINRTSTLDMLKQVRSTHRPEIPISIVLDNAKYNHASEVKKYAEDNRMQLIYLPPYSPNLNLIERLWKFMKGKVCTKYYEKFKEFKKAILQFFEHFDSYQNDLKSLITENFQIIGT